MTRFAIRPARQEDDASILSLIGRTPQPGRVVLNFERAPGFFKGAAVTCEQPEVWVAEACREDQDDELVAVFNIGQRQVFVDGHRRAVRYAHDLRIDPRYRGSLLLVRMFRRLKTILAEDEWMQTVILSGNDQSISTVGSGRAGLPTYYPFGDIQTSLLFSAPQSVASDVEVAPATPQDLPDMQAFLDEHGPQRQFFPCYRLQDLVSRHPYYLGLSVQDFWLARRDGELVGLVGVWDQKPFKQTRLLRYPRGLAWARHGYNVWSRLLGGVHLPPSGGVLDYRSTHTLLIRDNDAEVLRALLAPLVAQTRAQRAALVVAFFEGDPLADAMRGFRRQCLRSHHFLVSYGMDPRAGLDPSRLPYVEVARL